MAFGRAIAYISFRDLFGEPALIQIEMATPFQICESRFAAQIPDGLLKKPGRFIQVKRVGRAHCQMNFAVQQRTDLFPVSAQNVRDVLVLFPVRSYLGIDLAPVAVKKRHGAAIFPSRTEHPFERCQLTTIIAQNMFLVG